MFKTPPFITALDNLINFVEDSSKLEIPGDLLYDDNGDWFDFKRFSPSCVELASNYKEQANKIFNIKYVVYYLVNFKNLNKIVV